MAKQAFMARVKAYRKLHPRTSQVEAMKILAGKKARVAGVKKPKKKSIIKTERITTIGSHKTKTHSPMQRGISISRKIEDLEILLRNTTGITAKNHVKRLINAEHDKLDAITKNLKSA